MYLALTKLLLIKLFVYGNLGLLIEVWFTGIHSAIFEKDKSVTSTTYLPMCFIYGFASLALEAVSHSLEWPFYLKALLYVPIIYGIEALSGWTYQKLLGRIPWHYKNSAWSPAGLVNLKYGPFWLLLAMAFDPITTFLTKLLHALTLVA